MNELVTLKKIEQSRLAIREVKDLSEIRKLIDQGEALKAYAKSAKMSAEIQSDIAELNLIAERRLGEISSALEKSKGGEWTHKEHSSAVRTSGSKTAALADVNVTRQRASEAEKLAKIDEGVFNTLLKASRVTNIPKKDIEKIAELEPEKQRAVADKISTGEAKSVSEAVRQDKLETVKENLEDISAKKAKKLQGVYDVIVIDPPWKMEKIERDERPRQAGFDYPTMSEDELAGLKIPSADNCHVFLWATHKHLPLAFRLLENWKFKYVCTFVWHKNGGFQPFGLPQYNCEFCLYAHKGSPKFIDFKNFFTCFNADRTGHSEKPEVFYETLRRVTAGRRLDMYSRRDIKGFDAWGNEA
jgi:N6-adenosine-specific RNA methylase IME4